MSITLVKAEAADLCIPKTASTWRKNLYQQVGIDIGFHGRDKHSPTAPEGWKRFTFVRHPVSWLESKYHMGGVGLPRDPFVALYAPLRWKTFQDFLDRYLEAGPLVGEYFGHYTADAWRVGRLEHLHHDLWVMLLDLGYRCNLHDLQGRPPDNKTGRGPLEWPAGYKQAVLDNESDLIERYYSGTEAG